MSKDEISTLVNRWLGDDYRLVAELAVGGQEAIILGYGVGQIVLSFTRAVHKSRFMHQPGRIPA